MSVANTLNFPDFPRFVNADSEIFISQYTLESYSIEFSFDLPKEPPLGGWKEYVNLSMAESDSGPSFTHEVVKTSPRSLGLEIDFGNIDVEPTT